MLQYVLAGLALGSIYAIAASALVVTYVSSGVLNFAFGSMAFVVARVYYWLNSQHHMSTMSAGLLSILVLAPLLGVFLYAVLFRFVRGQVDAHQGRDDHRSVGGAAADQRPHLRHPGDHVGTGPGVAELTSRTKFLGAAVTTDQVLIYGFLLLHPLAGTAVLRFTDIGLRVRAMVDSEAMTSLSGTSPNRVSVGVWAVSATLAGLAGVLVAPTNGLVAGGHDDPDGGGLRRRGRRPAAFAAGSRRGGAGDGHRHRRHPEVPAAQQLLHRRDHPEHPVRLHRRGADHPDAHVQDGRRVRRVSAARWTRRSGRRTSDTEDSTRRDRAAGALGAGI